MDRVDSDKAKNLQVPVWGEYRAILDRTQDTHVEPTFVERFQFYEQAKRAYAVIITGDNAKYGNVILKKGLALD
jgi:L-fucose mutarotase